MNKKIQAFAIAIAINTIISSISLANDLAVTNVSLTDRNPSSSTVNVSFDVSWENSWKTKVNHDAIWLTVRLAQTTSGSEKKLCSLSSSGITPTGMSAGSNSNLEIYIPSDKKGAFLRPSKYGINSAVSSANVLLKIDYSSCGFSSSNNVTVNVIGYEMVFVPEGAFYVGDRGNSTASLVQGSVDNDPWFISSENLLTVSNSSNDGYRYVGNGNVGEDSTGTAFTIPAAYPKGFSAFYAMKYEINEGQWVEFINSLPAAKRVGHDLTDNLHKNSDAVAKRNTIACSGSPLVCSTSRPFRALNYLTWMDLAAFLDWAALRPMTELEFEKAARGPLYPLANEFAWGSSTVVELTTISGTSESGDEVSATTGANANYNNGVFSGGDSANGAEYSSGPVRNGFFANASSGRESAGASYYGLMELSGNLAEMVVSIGNSAGRSFLGSMGDGVLSSVTNYEGNADQTDWPGIDGTISARGVTGAVGSGVRGGSWADQNSGAKLHISDRSVAASGNDVSNSSVGGRGVRTYDGN